MQNEECHNLYFLQILVICQIKDDEIGEACCTDGTEWKYIRVLVNEHEGDSLLEDLFINVCVVLCIVCFVSFCVLFVCKYVLYCCHWVVTQLQLINITYHMHRWDENLKMDLKQTA